jgi:hypothetical protein
MYRIFKANILLSRRSNKKRSSTTTKVDKQKKEEPEQEEDHPHMNVAGGDSPPNHDDGNHHEEDGCKPQEVREDLHLVPMRLTRSLSRDSFSTFTTAAETPPCDRSSARSSVIVWGDLPMPLEIYICSGNQELECGKRSRKSRLFPEPTALDTREDECEDDDDDDDAGLCFLPKGMIPEHTMFKVHPSKSQYYDSQVGPPLRQRSHSNGDVDYLKAPERWTRFEI